jgi:opacity protein-like surface antigen
MLFASPATAKVPSNAELHQMIVGVMQKMETLQSENRALKRQLASLRQGKTYASVSPNVVPASVPRKPSLIKAVVRNVKQVPQLAANSAAVELLGSSQANHNAIDKIYYVRASTAYSILEDVRAEDENGDAGTASFSKGVTIEAAIGNEISNKWRAEFELSYRNFEPNRVIGFNGGNSQISIDPIGNVDLYAAYFNGYYKLPVFREVFPYIGAGVGVAYLKGNNLSRFSSAGTDASLNRQEAFNEHFWLPTGNISTGMTIPLTQNWDVDFGYKFALFGDLSGSRGRNSANSSVLKIHNLNGGLRYKF